MTDAMADNLEKLEGNITIRLVARLSMILCAPVLGIMGWLAMSWLDTQFTQQAHATATVQAQVEEVSQQIPALKDRALTLETNSLRGRAEREKFQDDAIRRFDALQSSISIMNGQISALIATIEAQQRQLDRKR